MKCDICERETSGVTIFNIMERKPAVHACMNCTDSYPCATGDMWNGIVTCSHGRRWKSVAYWDGAPRKSRAHLYWEERPSAWWNIFFRFFFRCQAAPMLEVQNVLKL